MDLVGAHGRFAFRRGGEESRSLAALAHGAIDPRALAARAAVLAPNAPGETPYDGVEAIFRSDGAQPEGAAEPPPDDASAPAFLRAALDRVLDRILAGTKRVAVLAGGGVDSSCMLALAVAWARRSPASRSVFAVALDFAADGDDRPHLRAVEARLGCEVVRVRPEDASRWMPLVVEGVDGAPFTWCTGPCEVEMMARARAHGAERVLTGVGGDELFDGEPRSLAQLVRSGAPLRAFVAARAMRGFDRPRSPALSWLLRPLVVEAVPRDLRMRRAARSLDAPPPWAGPTLRAVVHAQAAELASRAYAEGSRFEAFASRPHRMHLAWLRHQEEVAADVTRIDPYLDLELVRAVTSLPPAWLVRGARRRGLLRDALRTELPESVRERADKASFEPALERFVAAAGGLAILRPYVVAERLAALGIVEPSRFAEAAASFLARPSPEDWVTVWPALACEAFLRTRERR